MSELYIYDVTNRMVKGVNEAGEESNYVYDGFGYLIANEWKIEKNSATIYVVENGAASIELVL